MKTPHLIWLKQSIAIISKPLNSSDQKLDCTLVTIKPLFQKCFLFDKMSREATRNENYFNFQALSPPLIPTSTPISPVQAILPLIQASYQPQ